MGTALLLTKQFLMKKNNKQTDTIETPKSFKIIEEKEEDLDSVGVPKKVVVLIQKKRQILEQKDKYIFTKEG